MYDEREGGIPEFYDSAQGLDIDLLPSPAPSPEELFEEQTVLEAALGALTPQQGEAVLLWAEGYTYEEIGERLGITKQAAYHRVRFGRNQLREFGREY